MSEQLDLELEELQEELDANREDIKNFIHWELDLAEEIYEERMEEGEEGVYVAGDILEKVDDISSEAIGGWIPDILSGPFDSDEERGEGSDETEAIREGVDGI